MAHKTIKAISLFAVCASVLVGCSTAGFDSKSTSASSQNSSKSTDSADASAKPNTDGGASGAPAVASTDGSSAFASTSFAAISTKDTATPGCSLPANVANLMKGSVSANLTGWGGGGAPSTPLINLNLGNCDWFVKAKAANIARYMVVFTDSAKKQSYAQPFVGAANAVAFAGCIASAAAASAAAGGTVACEFMPF